MYKLCEQECHPEKSYMGYTGEPIPENAVIKIFHNNIELTSMKYHAKVVMSVYYGRQILYDYILPALIVIPHKRVLGHCRLDLIIRIFNNTHERYIHKDLLIELRKICMISCRCSDCFDREYITDISRSPSPELMFKRLNIE